MRSKGKGQQFDRLWGKLNNLSHDYWFIGRDIDSDLKDLKSKVEMKIPKSDYEVKDKNNLLEQISMLALRNQLLQQEIQEESEI